MAVRFILLGACLVAVLACGGQSRPTSTSEPGGAGGESNACKAGKSTYHEKRAELVKAAEEPLCQSDADCGILQESNACVVTCGTPLPAASITKLHAELDGIAQAACGTCPPLPIPPCVPPGPLTCQQGACVN